jgi:hypothetical protein
MSTTRCRTLIPPGSLPGCSGGSFSPRLRCLKSWLAFSKYYQFFPPHSFFLSRGLSNIYFPENGIFYSQAIFLPCRRNTTVSNNFFYFLCFGISIACLDVDITNFKECGSRKTNTEKQTESFFPFWQCCGTGTGTVGTVTF